jgi:hypothetical protein
VGCSRSGLDLAEDFPVPVLDAGMPDGDADGEPDAPVAKDVVVAPPPPTPAPSDPCANMPPIPCPGGGYQYCVAGAYSQCPQRCVACIPGSQRVCFLGYCNHWGIQTCSADGMSFNYCQEESPPGACDSLARADHASAALEQCCVDNGYCCADVFNLSGTGNTGGQVGQCSSVTCSP